MVWASRSCSSTTSTPRWVSLLTKSAWSRWAFSTHITSSKSSSSLLLGVSRRWARPGAQTSTLRSLPTSEWTPYVDEADPVAGSVIVHCLSSGGCSDRDPAGPQTHGADDAAGHDHGAQRHLRGAEQATSALTARLDVEQCRRSEQDRGQQEELEPRGVEEEQGVGR